MQLTQPLSCKVVVSLHCTMESIRFAGHLIDGLSTVTIDSLYSTLKAVTRPIDTVL